MAIRKRNTPLPYQVYWNNPVTGARESKSFSSKLAAEKFDAEIKYRLKYEKPSFAPAEARPDNSKLTRVNMCLKMCLGSVAIRMAAPTSSSNSTALEAAKLYLTCQSIIRQ